MTTVNTESTTLGSPETITVTQEERPMPATVAQALARVMGELPAIGKDGRADPAQGGYAYRGIEQITREAQRLFARYGVVFVPRVIHHEIKDILVRDKPWTDTILTVEYDVLGPRHGTYHSTLSPGSGAVLEDKITVGPLIAIGRDNSDKGANKAMTQAFKYCLLQLLCISDAKDDGDQASYEADGRRTGATEEIPWKVAAPDMIGTLKRQIGDLPADRKAKLAEEWKAEGLHAIDYLAEGEEFGRADKLVQAHILAVARGEELLPPADALDALNARPATAVDPAEAEERGKLTAELSRIVLAVPAADRPILQSRLRGLFGPAEAMTLEQTRQAIDVATAWPDPAPGEPYGPEAEKAAAKASAEAEERPYTGPSGPANGSEVPTPPESRPKAPSLPASLADEIEAEVRSMKVADLAEDLRARGLPIPTTKDAKVRELLVARLAEASAGPAAEGLPGVG